MTSPSFFTDKKWSDRFIPDMQRIVGEHLIGPAPDDEDMKRNTDLIVLRLDPIRIACRIRKHGYYDSFGDEFTIRISRPSGTKTEFAKLIEGYGDYILYGFADKGETKIHAWILGDLRVFRLTFQEMSWKGKPIGTAQKNKDGSSDFMAFKISDFPDDFIVAQHSPEPYVKPRLLIGGKEVS